MDYNKHYIRIDEQNNIIHKFSDAFLVERGGNEQVLPGDICINEQGGRHFQMLGEINPQLRDLNGIFLYRWDGNKAIKA